VHISIDVQATHVCLTLLAGIRGTTGDSCSGDSGGPIFVAGNTAKEDLQVGLVSWGPTPEHLTCETTKGVNTDVADLRPWIDANVALLLGKPVGSGKNLPS
jgi:secreted trypsin-like serine protease